MHEMAIARSLLGIVLEECSHSGLKRVECIRIQVGALTMVVPDALTFCFRLLSHDTIASGAILDIEEIPVVVRCPMCGELFEGEEQFYSCPRCGPVPGGLELIRGRELTVVAIEGCDYEPDQDPCS